MSIEIIAPKTIQRSSTGGFGWVCIVCDAIIAPIFQVLNNVVFLPFADGKKLVFLLFVPESVDRAPCSLVSGEGNSGETTFCQ